jgi:hypothetical protein
LVPDPLRRSRVPRDLDPVSTRASETDDVESLGMTVGGIERIWARAECLYRSGFYPAIALCVRRHGQVVLDRAIGHARGNGPEDPKDAVRTLATPATPFVIFSASKAMTVLRLTQLSLMIYVPSTRPGRCSTSPTSSGPYLSIGAMKWDRIWSSGASSLTWSHTLGRHSRPPRPIHTRPFL